MRNQERVLAEVAGEVFRQERLKAQGRFDFTPYDRELSDTDRLAMLTEEIGEVARECLQPITHDGEPGDLRAELIQAAAICTAWVEGIDARRHPLGSAPDVG